MTSTVELFYDKFSPQFIRDYVYGNARIERQFNFFSDAIPTNTESVLVIGCGSGQGAHFIATRVARKARILAVDISAANLQLAKTLFSNNRIEYRKANIITEAIEDKWDIIVLPDVYEHISIEARRNLHSKINELLSKNGRVLFTVPSPGKQASLYAKGEGLQVVDEVVTLEDISTVANDIGGVLTYFNVISVWNSNDYFHAVVERGAEQIGLISEADKLPIKSWLPKTFLSFVGSLLMQKLGIVKLQSWWRRRRVTLIARKLNSNFVA